VKESAGDITVFLDDDALVQQGWWPAIIKPLVEERIQEPEVRSQESEGKKELGVRSQQGAPTFGDAGTGDRRTECASHIGENEGIAARSAPPTLKEEQGVAAGDCAIHIIEEKTHLTHHQCIACVAGAVWCNPRPTFTDQRGGYVNWRGEPIQITHRSDKAPVNVDWPMTTNMAIRKDVFCDIGGFPAVYGIYDEDVDLGLKIRRAGWGIRFAAQAAVYHTYLLRPARIPTKQYMFLLGRNRSILLVRHFGNSLRLALFFLTAPFIQGWRGIVKVVRCCVQAIGHFAAYVAGMVVGVVLGIRSPVSSDKERWEVGGRESEGRGQKSER
jgi:hypothetical protein